jgi:hypothetical protein
MVGQAESRDLRRGTAILGRVGVEDGQWLYTLRGRF